MLPAWLWAVFTVIASGAQTARNAMQRDLVGSVGTQGATYVRFLFGLPFATLFLIAESLILDLPVPTPDLRALGWAAVGALMQTVATALMLLAMRDRSFVVTIAFTKTEPIIIALLSIVLLGEFPTRMTVIAIVVATVGVLLMSLPRPSLTGDGHAGFRPALIGLASGACFGFSSTGYRGAVIALQSPSFIMTATTALFIGLVIQCLTILVWLLARDRALLMSILRAWRPSLFAGFMGALASQFWFLAFAITNPTRVRTLALIEVPFAQVVSRRVFKQRMTPAEIAGMALIVIGVILLMRG